MDECIGDDKVILVTLGTQDKKFYRILDEIEKLIEKGKISEKVVVQAGCSSDYKSNHMEIFDLISMKKFDELISECDLLITHGGVGSIITGLKNNKKVIAVARLKKYKEHTNDHQLQIIENFSKGRYVIGLNDVKKLEKAINKSRSFNPKKYNENKENFVLLVENEINKYLGDKYEEDISNNSSL